MPSTLKALLLAAFLADTAIAAPAGAPIENAIEQVLGQRPQQLAGCVVRTRDLLAAYEANGFRPFWTDRARIRSLLESIERAPDHGLEPRDYDLAAIRELLAEPGGERPPDTVARDDVLLTESLLRYLCHRRFGKLQLRSLDPYAGIWEQALGGLSPAETIEEALSGPSLDRFIESVAAAGPLYRALQGWLQRYRRIEAAGGWPGVPDGPTLHPGDTDARVPQLRARLRVTGELSAEADSGSMQVDLPLEEAIRAFQGRHGLRTDGLAGRRTLAAMNVPVGQRVDQIRLSLERLRWVERAPSQTQVVVNIAGFRAFFYRNGRQVWETRTIVGRSYRQTPLLRSEITHLEFNPSWTIPPTILRNDILPAVRDNPGYLAERQIRIVDDRGRPVDPSTLDWSHYGSIARYTLQQEPGPENPMGRVKFMFPNEHLVYLHDTPARALFDNPERTFSSGCIRIENPLQLAVLLLNDSERHSSAALDRIVATGETSRVDLPQPVPVTVVYLTASVDSDGGALFYNDVYGRDCQDLEALDRPAPSCF